MGTNPQKYIEHPAAVYSSTGVELSFEFSTKIEFSAEKEISSKINFGEVGSPQPRISAVRFSYFPQIVVSTTVLIDMTPSLFLFAMGNNLVSLRNSNYSYTKDRLPAYLPIFSFWFLRKSILMDLLALSGECCWGF